MICVVIFLCKKKNKSKKFSIFKCFCIKKPPILDSICLFNVCDVNCLLLFLLIQKTSYNQMFLTNRIWLFWTLRFVMTLMLVKMQRKTGPSMKFIKTTQKRHFNLFFYSLLKISKTSQILSIVKTNYKRISSLRGNQLVRVLQVADLIKLKKILQKMEKILNWKNIYIFKKYIKIIKKHLWKTVF